MTSSLFGNFLQQLDNKMGAKARKILLFVDNAPCHPPEADDNVAICGDLLLDDVIEEALPSVDTAATSDEDTDDATDAVPVPTTFAEVLRHIDGIQNFIFSRFAAETSFWTLPNSSESSWFTNQTRRHGIPGSSPLNIDALLLCRILHIHMPVTLAWVLNMAVITEEKVDTST
ncbi:uncharacterized protein LOC142584587 [Dermacentor variabilis]|uniref:uncharacterized protein LOC142584587 n=1 Tax=Dermacentor variabilis TaxID=34621 RepID=UPI003F5B563C